MSSQLRMQPDPILRRDASSMTLYPLEPVAWIGEPGIHISQGSQDPMLLSPVSPQAVLEPVTLCLCMHTQKYRDSLEPVEVPKD